MQAVAKFHKTEDAYLFRSYLESEGIPAHVFDENFCQWLWYYTFTIGGVRVVVADEDVDEALSLYKDYDKTIAAEPAVVGDVKFWPFVLLLTFLMSVPLIIFGRKPPKSVNGKS